MQKKSKIKIRFDNSSSLRKKKKKEEIFSSKENFKKGETNKQERNSLMIPDESKV